MKKAVALFSMLMLWAVSAHAVPDRIQKVDIGVNLAGNIQSDSSSDDAFCVSGNVSYGIYDWLALGLSIGWAEPGSSVNNGNGAKVSGPDITMVPIIGDIILRSPTYENSWQPYGVIGFGGILTGTGGEGTLNSNNLNATDDGGFAFKLGAGIDWFTSDNWALYGELGYVFTTAAVDIKRNTDGSTVDSVDIDYFYIGGGVKYLFS